jgi:hypothetical protein
MSNNFVGDRCPVTTYKPSDVPLGISVGIIEHNCKIDGKIHMDVLSSVYRDGEFLSLGLLHIYSTYIHLL